MPNHAPFTRLCQTIANTNSGRADLHVHSTFSDGTFTPDEIIARAKQAGLSGIAIADHDTLSGYLAVHRPIAGIELVPGVEITAEFQGRELHLLGYYFDPQHSDLSRSLERVRVQRRVRFEAIVDRLHKSGVILDRERLSEIRDSSATLGRRHLARLLIEGKHVGNCHSAFVRYLNLPEILEIPRLRLPVAEAIELVHAAGGVTSWAHPSQDATIEQMRELSEIGLDAVECEYPWSRASHGKNLRAMAEELGLAITGGSDCHGPQPNNRAIGVRGISRTQLDQLRDLSVCRRPIFSVNQE